MEEFNSFRKQFLIRYVLVFLVLMTPILLAGYIEAARGVAFGALLAGLFFIVHGHVLSRAVTLPPMRARFNIVSHYVLRYVLYFIALIGTIQRPDIHFLGVAAGLILPRIVILLFYTFNISQLEPLEGTKK